MVSIELKHQVDGLSREDKVSLAGYLLREIEPVGLDVSDGVVLERQRELQTGKTIELEHGDLIERLRSPKG